MKNKIVFSLLTLTTLTFASCYGSYYGRNSNQNYQGNWDSSGYSDQPYGNYYYQNDGAYDNQHSGYYYHQPYNQGDYSQNREYYYQQPSNSDSYYQRNQSYSQPNNQQAYYYNQSQQPSNSYQESSSYYSQPYTQQDYQSQQTTPFNSYQRNDRSSNQQAYYDRNQNNNGGYYNNRDDASQNNRNSNNVTDQDISKKINDAVGSGWLTKGYPNVTFDVNNGNVTLRGSVKSIDDKNKIEDNVRKIDGVQQINNQITVNPNDKTTAYRSVVANNDSKVLNAEESYPQDSAATDSDRLLNAQIRDKFKGWFSNSYENLTLNTKNGVVNIRGVVDSADDIKTINDKLKDINGVKAVNNQLTIKNK